MTRPARRCWPSAACLILFVLFGLAPAAQDPTPAPQRVLFIGNSYTYFNNLPELVAAISRSLPNGPRIEPVMYARGGMTLQWYWATGEPAALIDGGGWTHVVLQEQSALGAGTDGGDARLSPPGIFHQSVRTFVPRIRAAGAEPMLLMTWARLAKPDEQAQLTSAYDTIGQELGVTVSPVGLAWQQARRQWPDLALHVADGAHPNPVGSYLTACVLYASLTGRSPRGAAVHIEGHPYSRALRGIDAAQTVTLVDVPKSLGERLQALAWTIVTQRAVGKG
jgi:hypothetical protein